jgi:hypothetical protein
MKKLILSLSFCFVSMFAFSQTARIQAIHNSPDAATAIVDVYLTTTLGSSLLIDDFEFRNASPFIDAPAGSPISISFAPSTSGSILDAIPGLTFNFTLTSGSTYILVADGIFSSTGYSPIQPFDIKVYNMGREMSNIAGNTDVLVHHGSTDAPTVDVRERTLGATVVNNASYPDFTSYLELPNADYILDVQTADGLNTVASYSAPLAVLGLQDSALIVVASGFLNPAINSGGPAFGLYVALPEGGALIQLPSAASPTANVQVIHNCADAIADSVDVYINGALALNNFAFRTATPFIDLPATAPLQVAIAPKNSSSISDTITGAVFNYNLGIDETYVLVADGIVSATGYSPAQPFDIKVYAMGREMASTSGETDVLVHHGSTDAPCVDVDEVTAGNLVNDACYGDFAGYLELPTADYTLSVKDATGTVTVVSYLAPLATLNLDDSAIVVVASGFLNPAVNSGGPAFGLFVALASGGELIALPETTLSINEELENSLLNVYPNPATDILNLNAVDLQDKEIRIVDITGRSVKNLQFNSTGNTIDVTDLTPGTYQLLLMDGSDKVAIKKFVKL